MSGGSSDELSLMELFRLEVGAHGDALTRGLLALEQRGAAADVLEELMRSAHSIKGAARIVGLRSAERVAHAMEEVFVTSQRTGEPPERGRVDVLLRGVDFLGRVSLLTDDDIDDPLKTGAADADAWIAEMRAPAATPSGPPPAVPAPGPAQDPTTGPATPAVAPAAAVPATAKRPTHPTTEIFPVRPGAKAASGVLRVDARRMDRILGLAGLARVETGRIRSFSSGLLHLRERYAQLATKLDGAREAVRTGDRSDNARAQLDAALRVAEECRNMLSDRLTDVQDFERRTGRLSRRLHDEAVATRMRPLGDGVAGLARMVRDLAHSLGKEAVLEIQGENTPIDRDVLERIEAPLTHLIRNALDHGLEAPADREAAGKPRTGRIVLSASHGHGRLQLSVSDDGGGVDIEELRRAVVGRGLEHAEVAEELSDDELLQFLMLPEFTLKREVTEISGRGVGLDVVRSVVRTVGGTLRIASVQGEGTRFDLHLPLTLSITRALAIDICGEVCAIPLNRIAAVLSVPATEVQRIEGRAFVRHGDGRVGLIAAGEILELGDSPPTAGALRIIVIGEALETYGLVVDRVRGEQEFVVQPLDRRLGKIADVSAGAMLEDGTPVLLLDVDDLVRSVEARLEGLRLGNVRPLELPGRKPAKRLLVVDDSITVREVERKLLETNGYEVEVCVDGVDAWNALRAGRYDLVLTDVDMPRMDGIALLERIRAEPTLARVPVVIVSYKDREEDRQRGLEAGADYYLTKGSFHDEALLRAVEDLIGKAHS